MVTLEDDMTTPIAPDLSAFRAETRAWRQGQI
jgi:hypothetical protein